MRFFFKSLVVFAVVASLYLYTYKSRLITHDIYGVYAALVEWALWTLAACAEQLLLNTKLVYRIYIYLFFFSVGFGSICEQ